uniref:DUF805 domain-containing protein n=1 Tax=Heterorhabditis bacteriophora TaxID=37862 RepID=A0A1I7XQT9_HETBA
MVFSLVRDYLCNQQGSRILDGEWRNSSINSLPHVTECVQHLDLSWTPTLFLILFCPITLYDLYVSDNARTSCHSPITYRIFLCIILVIDLTGSFFYNVHSYYLVGEDSALQYLIGDVAQYIGLCIALTLLIACRNRGIVTSGVLFLYWLLLVICGFPEFRYLLDSQSTGGGFRFFLICIYYPTVCLELLLSCFADSPSRSFNGTKECPELSTSFLNQITFNWFTKLAVKGNSKPLERDDLWDLNERDRSSTLIPKFNENFIPEVRRRYTEIVVV